MTDLQIAKELALPRNAVTQTFGFIARKGAGKTYACGKLVELLHAAGARFIVLDIVGNWGPGLRLAADGKRPGIQVPIFGGDHADVPIDTDSAGRLARVLVAQAQSAVIDVSLMRKGERVEFVTEFAEELFFAKKTDKRPLLVAFEEAHKFAPQMAKGQERMLGAVEDIVRLGRNYGLGAALISQRPQSINKEVLNQVECLFVGQLNGAHERDAIRDWVKTQEADKTAKTLDLLPTLAPGRMVCWSPQWLKYFGVVSIAKKWTFDASATPELGTEAATVKLEAFDAEALAAALEEDEGSARPKRKRKGAAAPDEEDDGAEADLLLQQNEELRARVLELEARPPVSEEQIARLEAAAQQLHTTGIAAVEAARGVMAALPPAARETLPAARDLPPPPVSARPVVHRDAKPAKSPPISVDDVPPRAPVVARTNGSSAVGRCAREILTALHQHGDLSLVQAAIIAGYASDSGGVRNAAGELRAGGFAEGSNARLSITARGRAEVSHAPKLPTGRKLAEYWYGKLSRAERLILSEVVAVYPKALALKDAASRAGFEPTSGGVRNAAGKLRTLALVHGGNVGMTADKRLVG